jgi:hypothetical protein
MHDWSEGFEYSTKSSCVRLVQFGLHVLILIDAPSSADELLPILHDALLHQLRTRILTLIFDRLRVHVAGSTGVETVPNSYAEIRQVAEGA